MYARLLTFNLGPGMRDFAMGMANEAFDMVKTMNGFVSATYLILDEPAGEYGSLVVWETLADAEASGDVLRPWMMEKAGDKLTKAPEIRHAEVYKPI